MLEIVLLLLALVFAPQNGWLLLICVAVIAVCLPGAYATVVGAPFFPTKGPILKRMIDLAQLQPGEVCYDLGCGDGRILLAAAAKGATAIGYELSIPMYLWSAIRCALHRKVSVRYGDFWKKDLSDADVIFCYLLTDTMKTFKTTVWPQLRPGCRVVSHSFRMEGIEPDVIGEKVVLYKKKA